MTILKNNHKSGINENNIKVATVTEEQVQSRGINPGTLPLLGDLPIRVSTQVYQVSTLGNVTYPENPECSSQSYIFCKVTVTANKKFKTISKALLKIQKYAGDESGEFGVYPASENALQSVSQHTNYLKTVTKNSATYAVIDISEKVKEGKSKTFYLAIKSEDGSVIRLQKTGIVEVSYIEDDDLIPSGKLEKQVGSKGGYAINARNGKLQYNQQIFASKGGLMPFGLSLSYNATNCDSSSPNGIANSMKGWTFNYQQSLQDYLGKMLYVDASNVVHTFKNPTNDTTVWYDATGKNGMVLVATDTGYSMSDGKTATLNFDTSKRLVSIVEKLSDTKNATTTIEYASDGKISKVTDGLGDVYNFTWTSTLVQIKKGDTLLSEVTLADERVTQVKYVLSGDTVSFAYDANGQLISALDSASKQKALFDYNTVGAISAVKNYIRNVDGNEQITDVATDSNHFEYKLLQTRIASCRNSDAKSNAYSTMAYLFAEDGELLTTTEVKGSVLQPLRCRTKLDFEKSSGTIPDKELVKVLFNGEEAITATEEVSSSEFELNTQNQVFNTYLFTASACITTNNYVADDTQKLTVQIVEGTQVIGSAEFDPSKRDTETVCGYITLVPGVHTLQAKLVMSNLKAQVSFGYVKVYSTKNGAQKQYVNVAVCNDTATEHDGTTQTLWYQHNYCSLCQDDVVLAENVIFNAKDYALTLISRRQNPTAYNVWYNDGKNMLFQVSNVSLTWSNGVSQTLENLKVCTLSSTIGKTIFEYIEPSSEGLYKTRKATTISTDDEIDGAVAEEFINDNFQTVKVVDEHGISTEYTYNANGSVTKVVTKAPIGTYLNIEESSTYFDNNLLKSSSHRRNLVDYTQSFVYGSNYELTQEIQPNTQATNFAYSADKDKLTSISSTIDDATSQNEITYDGDLVDTLSDTRTAVDFAYDERLNISQVDIGGTTVLSKEITYNPNGTTQSVTTYGNGQSLKKYYDKFDRLIKVSDITEDETVLVQYFYNDVEIDKTTFDPATFTPTISANSPLRVVVDHAAGTTTWYTYDEFGQVKKTENQKLITRHTYDEFNRLSYFEMSFGGNMGTTYTYASPTDDTLVAEETVWDMPGEISTTYARDQLQRPTETTVMQGDYGYKTVYSYVPRKTKKWIPGEGLGPIVKSSSVGANAITPPILDGYWEISDVGTTQYISQFKQYNVSGSTETLSASDTVAYDANGNITQYGSVTYQYDSLNRLVRENNATPGIDKTITWCYDVSGNIVSRTEYTRTSGDLTDVTPTATYTYTYGNGWKDQLKSFNGQAIEHDDTGNPTIYKGASLTWERGRLLAGYKASGSNYTTTMQYDANGIRKQKLVPSPYYTTTTEYLYSGNNLLRETIAQGNAGQVSTKYKTYLYNSQGIIGFVYQGVTYTYRKNLFGDIIAIYQGATKVAEYAYDAYGNCTIKLDTNGIGANNPFRYRGYYWDSDLQLYYLMSRYYDPQTGRFINADSLEYLDPETVGGLNLYSYCGNNPVMGIDPEGHMPQWAKWLVGGLAIAGLVVATILTCGAAGAAAASVGAAMLAGGLVSAGMNTFEQLQSGEDFDWTELAISTLAGTAYGLMTGLTGGAGAGAVIGKFAIAGGESLLNSWNDDATFGEAMKSLGTALLLSGAAQLGGHLAGKFGPKILSKLFPKNPDHLLTMADIGSTLWNIPAVKAGAMRFMIGVGRIISNLLGR